VSLVDGEMGLRPLQKRSSGDDNLVCLENKIPSPFRGGVPGDEFFIPFKRTHKPSLKKPQSFEAYRKRISIHS
jgi:hypothetical protein